MCYELKIPEIKVDFVPFRVLAVDKNAPGVTCFSSNTLGWFFLAFFQLLLAVSCSSSNSLVFVVVVVVVVAFSCC